MFQHPRKLIRRYTRDLLKGTGPSFATPAGDRVYATRFLPMRPHKCPALAVYTLDTNTVEDSVKTAPRILEHQVDLVVDALFRVEAPFDPENPTAIVYDEGDAMALLIEDLMGSNSNLGGHAGDSWLLGTEWVGIDTRDAHYACLQMTFAAFYERAYPHVDDVDALDDFLRGDMRYRPNSVIPTGEAHDAVDLPGP